MKLEDAAQWNVVLAVGLSRFFRVSHKIANFCHTEECRAKKWGRIFPEFHWSHQMYSLYAIQQPTTLHDVVRG